MNPRLASLLVLLLSTLATPTRAALPYAGGDLLQNFDSLPGSGDVAWTDNQTLPGWFAHQSSTGAAPATLRAPLAAGTSTTSNSKGLWFNFGSGADRALGGSPAGSSGVHSYGLALTNTSGATLATFSLAFDWEQWFVADIAEAQNLRFAYSTDATSLTTGTWTEVPAALLTLTAGGSQVWLGTPLVFPRSVTVTGLAWDSGKTLWLRWQDINEGGGDHGVGIDNVSFSAQPAGPPPPPPPAPAATVSLGPWSGAVTSRSARVHVKMSAPASGARLLVSTEETMADPWRIEAGPEHAGSAIATFRLESLVPHQLYHYAVERSDGTVDLARRGRLRAFPSGPASFTFVFAACADTGSNHRVFDHIAAADPLFYLNIGDLHYADIAVNNPASFRSALDAVLGSARQSALYRAVPLAYMWDDHDYGPNDSDRLSPGRPAALRVYREYIPHYPLALDGDDAPIDQSFTVGRARFILSDLRSQRDPKSQTDNASKRMLSTAQLDWLKQELLAARAARQAIFWVSTVPWIEPATAGSDMWGGYSTQRRELADFIADNQIENIVILAGDSHMLAADDGSNANFSARPSAPRVRVLQAAALDRSGSVKGGPYSAGTFPGGGQYGHVTLTDLGDTLRVRFSGRAVDASSGAMTERVSLQFDLPVGPALPPVVPQLQDIKHESDGSFSFQFEGSPDRDYRVQFSEDLVRWLDLGPPSSAPTGRFFFTDREPRNSSRRFYRVLVD